MIKKEQAQALVNERQAQIKKERAEITKQFCEETASQAIEESAKEGKARVTVGCKTEYAQDIANYLRLEGGYSVNAEMYGANTMLHISW